MNRKRIYTIKALLCSLLFMGIGMIACKRSSDGKELLGMRIAAAPEGFYVIMNQFEASDAAANFASGSITFNASLSHEVTWTITVRGLLSGAVKQIVKTSQEVNEPWDGNASNIYFFRQGEKAVAEITFMGSGLVLRDTLTVASTKVYNNTIVNGVRYTLIDDFDGNGVPMLSASKDAFDGNVFMAADSTFKVQGVYAFKMSGTDLSNNGWSGGVNHTNLTEIKTANRSPQTSNPEDLYINMYVYGTGLPNSAIEIKMYEIDDAENFNQPGYVYEQHKNDAWIVQIPVTWTGWKCISKKYSTFTSAKDPALGGNGNKIKQPHQITGMAVSLLSLPNPGSTTSVYVDYVILSEGGVFIP